MDAGRLFVQVLELWEDTSSAAAELLVTQRHYVRVLYNGREIALPPASTGAGEPVTLARFKETILDRFAVNKDTYAGQCEIARSWWGARTPKVDTSSY
jgi:hypothetical protein